MTEETYFWGAESKKWEPTFLTKARLGVQVPGSNHSPPPPQDPEASVAGGSHWSYFDFSVMVISKSPAAWVWVVEC